MTAPEAGDIESRLKFRVGTDLLLEFVAGHSHADVLRELVQNEYDAGGTRLAAEFREHQLIVTGNGSPIDKRGWRRLSVMMSTGSVAGPGDSETAIEAKVNGIGSKNLGLRSLFLLGDRIHVRSGGRRTVMDLVRGTLPTPDDDPSSRSSRGVEIRVPYRTEDTRLLQAFDAARESHAFEKFALELSDILIKLAQPRSRRSLTQVTVGSERLKRRIVWTQAATQCSSRLDGVIGVRRKIRRYYTAESGVRARSLSEELEFQRLIVLPDELSDQPIPGYFKAPRGRLRVSVSLRTRGDRLDPAAEGLFYYPLGVRSAPTGLALNVCAPFLMNGDRSALLDHPANDRLQAIAADLVAELLVHDWYYRFGPKAYAALRPRGHSSSALAVAVQDTLRTKPVWASASIRDGRAHDFVPAATFVLPAAPSLSGYLSDPKLVLDQPIMSEPPLISYVGAAGATRFTVNSFIRLRCGGSDGSGLQTKPGKGEANYHYTDFANQYKGPEGLALQRRMGETLDDRRRHLTGAHLHDLKASPSTLTADGSVSVAADLWFVPAEIQSAAQVPPSTRLHPELASSKTLVRLCRPFSVSDWLITVCALARKGTAGEIERDAAYRYIRSVEARLPSRVLGAVRRSPVFRNHRGAWVEPTSLITPIIPGADLLEPVLHFPHSEIAADAELLARLNIRRQLSGTDLVAFAQNHVKDEATAGRFERLLVQHRRLLTPRIAAQLGLLPILTSSFGGLKAARALYVPSALTSGVVGPDAEYVVGQSVELYRLLGCRVKPRSEDVLAYLATLSERREPPPQPDRIYGALVGALRAEGKPTAHHRAAAIVWTDSKGYVPPVDVLVGARIPRFLSNLPMVRGPESLCLALSDLGAARLPGTRHWSAFFRDVSAPYQPEQRVRRGDLALLRQGYVHVARQRIDLELPPDVRYLLARDATLHSMSELLAGDFVINDYPQLAEAAAAQGARVAIADDGESSQIFFATLRPQGLSDIAGAGEPTIGQELPAPTFVNESEILRQLHSADFASAVAALVRHELRSVAGVTLPMSAKIRQRLQRISRVVMVENIAVQYRVARSIVVVHPSGWLGADRITVAKARSRDEVKGALATMIAEAVPVSRTVRQRLSDAIYRILGARSPTIGAYLKQRGIPWEGADTEDLVEDELPDLEDTIETFVRSLVTDHGAVGASAARAAPGSPPGAPLPVVVPPRVTTPLVLPPLEEVSLEVSRPEESALAPRRKSSGGGGGTHRWQPPTPSDTQRDAAIGRRAEELVLRQERQRVAALGYDPNRVVWTADSDPGADHDIRSVDDDGEDSWLEVKGTIGTDGSFYWPTNQFHLAATHRHRYILWRVYRAASTEPVAKAFRDPIAMMVAGLLRVDISTLAGEVERLSTA